MNTITRLHEVMDQVDDLHQLLMKRYRTEPAEKKPGSWTIVRYNDLACAIDDATEILIAGLAGKYIDHLEDQGGGQQ